MIGLIFLSFYFLIPLVTSYGYHALEFKRNVLLTHLITLVLVIVYPIAINAFENWIDPPDPYQCSLSESIGMRFNLIVMVPATQGILVYFNKKYYNYKVEEPEVDPSVIDKDIEA